MREQAAKTSKNKSQALANNLLLQKKGKDAVQSIAIEATAIEQQQTAQFTESQHLPLINPRNVNKVPFALTQRKENKKGYTQENDMHIDSRQEKHLSNEAWHVLQQKQGRIEPAMQLKDKVNISSNSKLNEGADTINKNNKVIQRTPLEWSTADQIQRILQHPHGYFSTWKSIKEHINTYISLLPNDLHRRTQTLDVLDTLIDEWKTNPKHQADSSEDRVLAIRNDMPVLEVMIYRERSQIQEQSEEEILGNYYQTGNIVNENVPDTISNGIEGLANNAAKAARLFENINNFRFRYTGGYVYPRVAFTAHQGDCQTLVGMYVTAATDLGLNAQIGNVQTRMLVAPQAIHGRSTTSNTDPSGERFWYFQEHYWAICEGTEYDLLFMKSPRPNALLTNGNVLYNGVTYYTFEDNRCVIEPGNEQLTQAIRGEGRVFANAEIARQFIDTNHV